MSADGEDSFCAKARSINTSTVVTYKAIREKRIGRVRFPFFVKQRMGISLYQMFGRNKIMVTKILDTNINGPIYGKRKAGLLC